ncbi:MAG: hypothetical protein ACXAD7_03620 [Candidatus Kariarchaeaceae archaeon]|jgi:hypothetical protein
MSILAQPEEVIFKDHGIIRIWQEGQGYLGNYTRIAVFDLFKFPRVIHEKDLDKKFTRNYHKKRYRVDIDHESLREQKLLFSGKRMSNYTNKFSLDIAKTCLDELLDKEIQLYLYKVQGNFIIILIDEFISFCATSYEGLQQEFRKINVNQSSIAYFDKLYQLQQLARFKDGQLTFRKINTHPQVRAYPPDLILQLLHSLKYAQQTVQSLSSPVSGEYGVNFVMNNQVVKLEHPIEYVISSTPVQFRNWLHVACNYSPDSYERILAVGDRKPQDFTEVKINDLRLDLLTFVRGNLPQDYLPLMRLMASIYQMHDFTEKFMEIWGSFIEGISEELIEEQQFSDFFSMLSSTNIDMMITSDDSSKNRVATVFNLFDHPKVFDRQENEYSLPKRVWVSDECNADALIIILAFLHMVQSEQGESIDLMVIQSSYLSLRLKQDHITKIFRKIVMDSSIFYRIDHLNTTAFDRMDRLVLNRTPWINDSLSRIMGGELPNVETPIFIPSSGLPQMVHLYPASRVQIPKSEEEIVEYQTIIEDVVIEQQTPETIQEDLQDEFPEPEVHEEPLVLVKDETKEQEQVTGIFAIEKSLKSIPNWKVSFINETESMKDDLNFLKTNLIKIRKKTATRLECKLTASTAGGLLEGLINLMLDLPYKNNYETKKFFKKINEAFYNRKITTKQKDIFHLFRKDRNEASHPGFVKLKHPKAVIFVIEYIFDCLSTESTKGDETRSVGKRKKNTQKRMSKKKERKEVENPQPVIDRQMKVDNIPLEKLLVDFIRLSDIDQEVKRWIHTIPEETFPPDQLFQLFDAIRDDHSLLCKLYYTIGDTLDFTQFTAKELGQLDTLREKSLIKVQRIDETTGSLQILNQGKEKVKEQIVKVQNLSELLVETELSLESISLLLEHYKTKGHITYSLSLISWIRLIAIFYYRRFKRIHPVLSSIMAIMDQGVVVSDPEEFAHGMNMRYLNTLMQIEEDIKLKQSIDPVLDTTAIPKPYEEEVPVPVTNETLDLEAQIYEGLATKHTASIKEPRKVEVVTMDGFELEEKSPIPKGGTRRKKPIKKDVIQKPAVRVPPTEDQARASIEKRVILIQERQEKAAKRRKKSTRIRSPYALLEFPEREDSRKDFLFDQPLDHLQITGLPKKVLKEHLKFNAIEEFSAYKFTYDSIEGVGKKTNNELLEFHAILDSIDELSDHEFAMILSDTGKREYIKSGGYLKVEYLPLNVSLPLPDEVKLDILESIETTSTPKEVMIKLHLKLCELLAIELDYKDSIDTMIEKFQKFQDRRIKLMFENDQFINLQFSWGLKHQQEFEELGLEEQKELLQETKEMVMQQLEQMVINPQLLHLTSFPDVPQTKSDQEADPDRTVMAV